MGQGVSSRCCVTHIRQTAATRQRHSPTSRKKFLVFQSLRDFLFAIQKVLAQNMPRLTVVHSRPIVGCFEWRASSN